MSVGGLTTLGGTAVLLWGCINRTLGDPNDPNGRDGQIAGGIAVGASVALVVVGGVLIKVGSTPTKAQLSAGRPATATRPLTPAVGAGTLALSGSY